MKVRIGILSIVIAAIIIVVFSIKTTDVEYEQISIQQPSIDVIGIRNYISLFSKESNVYFFIKDSEVIMFSNLRKPGYDHYSIAGMEMRAGKLHIDIKGNKNAKMQSAGNELIVKLHIDQLPEKIKINFLGKRIKNYEIISSTMQQ